MEPLLRTCMTCGQPVQRQLTQTISAPKLSGVVTVSIAKQAGFTVLKRNSDGRFENQ